MIPYQSALITGASSPLGKALCVLLKEAGVFTIGVGRSDSHEIVDKFIQHDLSLPLSPSRLKQKAEVIFHLASSPGSRSVIKSNPLQIARSNVIDFNLLNFAVEANTTNLIYASSATAKTSMNLDLGNIHPDTIYGWQKRMTEEILLALSTTTDMKIRIARIFTLYGESYTSEGLIGYWLEQAKLGNDIEVWQSDVYRSLIHVRDAASALIGLSLQPNNQLIADVGSPDILTLKEIAKRIKLYTLQAHGQSIEILARENAGHIPSQICDLSTLKAIGWKNEILFNEYLNL